MALNTRNRRMAMLGLGSPVPRILPHPDGGFNLTNDRYMLLFLYPIFPEPVVSSVKRGTSHGGLWYWDIEKIKREDEEFLLILELL